MISGGVAGTEAEVKAALQPVARIVGASGVGGNQAQSMSTLLSKLLLWLGIRFDTINMTVPIPDGKLAEIITLAADWTLKRVASIHKLSTILGKLFYVALCCASARFFINRMLNTLRAGPAEGVVRLSCDFWKDI